MTDSGPSENPAMNMLIGRQLEVLDTGNAVYLQIFLRTARAAGLRVRLVMEHSRSFSNRPWSSLHPSYAPLVDSVVWPWSIRFRNRFLSLAPSVWGRFAIRLIKEAARKLGVRSGPLVQVRSTMADPLSEVHAARLARTSDAYPSELVVAEYSSMGPALAHLRSGAARGVLLHDLFSLRAESFRTRNETPDFDAPTLQQEAQHVAASDLLFFASANEMARLAPLLPKATTAWLRPEIPSYPDVTPAPPPRAVFLGTRHAGNLDALQALMNDIWPRVLRDQPDAQLWIAGSICKDLRHDQLALPGVKALGRVEDLSTLGGENSIGLAPTRIASGVSIKVAEYLRMGMPCIAYPIALEGFGEELSDLVDVVDGPEAFAARLVALFRDADGRRQRATRGKPEAGRRLDNGTVVQLIKDKLAARLSAHARSHKPAMAYLDSVAPASAGLRASSRHS